MSGTLSIPEVSHENTVDGLSDYIVRNMFALQSLNSYNSSRFHISVVQLDVEHNRVRIRRLVIQAC